MGLHSDAGHTSLIAPLWTAMAARGRPIISPRPIIVLLCGLMAPLLIARLDLPAPPPANSVSLEQRYFWADPASETPTIAPLRASAQIKRVAASRHLPYFVVRRLVDANTKDATGVDVITLNLALDRNQPDD